MGSQSTQGMIEMGGVSEQVMEWHLQSNHFPPVPVQMVPFAMSAVEAINEEDSDRTVHLPEGVEFRGGRTELAAWEAADALHLWDFVSTGIDDEV